MRRTVSVPAETTLDMVSLHRPVTGNDVLDGGCQQVAVVRGTGSEGRAIVEGVGLLLRRQFELPLKSIDFLDLGVSHGGLSVRAGRDGHTVHWARIRSSSLGKLTAMIVDISGRVARKVVQWYSTFLAAPTHRGGVTGRRWDEIWGNSWLNFPPSLFLTHRLRSLQEHTQADLMPSNCTILFRYCKSPQRVDEITTLSGYFPFMEKTVHFYSCLRDILCSWGDLETLYYCFIIYLHSHYV
jgi:hypothetical protein